MGTGASVEETRHSRLFQEGFRSLQEGRYTYAEIYYEQAIEKHDGHIFWTRLDDLINWEKKQIKNDWKKTNSKDPGSKGDANDGGTHEVTKYVDKEDDELEETDEEMMEDDSGIIEIPLDGRLEVLLDYLELRADIADSYMGAERYEEAAPHMQFITSRTNVLMQSVRTARESAAAEEENPSGNPLDSLSHTGVGNRRLRLDMIMSSDLERESVLDCFEQHLRLHWMSSLANTVYIASERFKEGQAEKKRKKELDSAILICSKVLHEILNVARQRSKSLTNAVVLNFLEAMVDDMDAESSVTSLPDDQSTRGKGKQTPRVNTLFENADKTSKRGSAVTDQANDLSEECPIKVQLQLLPDRRSLCRSVPAPQQGAALRYIRWIDEEIRQVVPGTNYNLEVQCGLIDEGRKKQLQKRSLKFLVQKKCDYNDRVLLGKSFDEENVLLLFPILLIQADVQFQLGAATKGIKALDLVEKVATQLYGMDSLERQSIMRSVVESRKRGGALFMMFED